MQGRLQTQDDHVSEPLNDGIRAVPSCDRGTGCTDKLIVANVYFVHEHSSVLGYNLQSSLRTDAPLSVDQLSVCTFASDLSMFRTVHCGMFHCKIRLA